MLAFKQIANRLDGSDGRPGNRFNPTNLDQVLFDNRSYSAELVADALIALCRSTPSAAATNGDLINLVPACTVLANWNKRYNLDAVGVPAFREFWCRASVSFQPVTFDLSIGTDDPSIVSPLLRGQCRGARFPCRAAGARAFCALHVCSKVVTD